MQKDLYAENLENDQKINEELKDEPLINPNYKYYQLYFKENKKENQLIKSNGNTNIELNELLYDDIQSKLRRNSFNEYVKSNLVNQIYDYKKYKLVKSEYEQDTKLKESNQRKPKRSKKIFITKMDVNAVINKVGKYNVNYLDVSRLNYDITKIVMIKNLKYLNISYNNIATNIEKTLSILSQLNKLIILDISYNKIAKIDIQKSQFQNLIILYANNNEIQHTSDIHFISQLKSLTLLNVYSNPCSVKKNYRNEIANLNFRIKILDKLIISDEERYPSICMNTRSYIIGSPLMNFLDRVGESSPKYKYFNYKNMIGVTDNKFKELVIMNNINISEKILDDNFNAVCDESLIKWYERAIKDFGWINKCSPIGIIQSAFRYFLARRLFTKIKDDYRYGALTVQKYFKSYFNNYKLKKDAKEYYDLKLRHWIIEHHFTNPKHLSVLINIQKYYSQKSSFNIYKRKSKNLCLKLTKLFKLNQVKHYSIYKILRLDIFQKIYFIKSQYFIIKKLVEKYIKLEFDKNVFSADDIETIQTPSPDSFKYVDSTFINIQKYFNATPFVIRKKRNRGSQIYSNFNYLKLSKYFDSYYYDICQKLQKTKVFSKNIEYFCKKSRMKMSSRTFDQYYNDFYYVQVDNFNDYKFIINKITMFNQSNYEQLIQNTIYLHQLKKNLIKKNSIGNSLFTIDYNDDHLKLKYGLIETNPKEDSSIQILNKQYPNLLSRKILGSNFEILAHVYDEKVYKYYNQIIFWPQSHINTLCAVVTIQSCWRRYLAWKAFPINVSEKICQNRAFFMIRKNFYRTKLIRRLHMLQMANRLFRFIHDNKYSLSDPKTKVANYNVVIDEVSFIKLMKMSRRRIEANCLHNEQFFLLNLDTDEAHPYRFNILQYFHYNIERYTTSMFPYWVGFHLANTVRLFDAQTNYKVDRICRKVANEVYYDDHDLDMKNDDHNIHSLDEIIKDAKNDLNQKQIQLKKKQTKPKDVVPIESKYYLDLQIFKKNKNVDVKLKLNLYGYNRTSLFQISQITFEDVYFFRTQPALKRMHHLIPGYDDSIRYIEIPYDNFDDALTLILITFLYTYDKEKYVLASFAKMARKKSIYDIYWNELIKNNLDYFELESYPQLDDFYNISKYNETISTTSVNLSKVNYGSKLISTDGSKMLNSRKDNYRIDHKKQIELQKKMEKEYVKEQLENNRMLQVNHKLASINKVKSIVNFKALDGNGMQNVDNLLNHQLQLHQLKNYSDSFNQGLGSFRIQDALREKQLVNQKVRSYREECRRAVQAYTDGKSASASLERERRKVTLKKLCENEERQLSDKSERKEQFLAIHHIAQQKKTNTHICNTIGRKLNKLIKITEKDWRGQEHMYLCGKKEELKSEQRRRQHEHSVDLSGLVTQRREQRINDYKRMKVGLSENYHLIKQKHKRDALDGVRRNINIELEQISFSQQIKEDKGFQSYLEFRKDKERKVGINANTHKGRVKLISRVHSPQIIDSIDVMSLQYNSTNDTREKGRYMSDHEF